MNLYSRSIVDRMFEWLTDLPRRQNNSAMERFIGKVNNSSELEDKMRNGIGYKERTVLVISNDLDLYMM